MKQNNTWKDFFITDKNEALHSLGFALIFHCGAINENTSLGGVTHLIEHLCYKGEKGEEFASFCEQNGVYVRGETGKDFLNFNFVCRPCVFNNVITFFHKMLYNLNYSSEEFALEKSIVCAEIAEKEPLNSQIIIDRQWQNKNFSNCILGNKERILNLSLTALINFKKQLLASEKSILLVGNYSEEQRDLVYNLFNEESHYKLAIKQQKSLNASQKNEVKFIVDNYENCDLYYALRFDISQTNRIKEILCLQVINSALFQGDCAYIKQVLREKNGLIYDVYSELNVISDEAILLFHLTTASKDLPNLIQKLENALEEFVLNDKYLVFVKAFFCDNSIMLKDNFKEYFNEYIANAIYFKQNISPLESAQMISDLSAEEANLIYRKLLLNKNVYLFGNLSYLKRKQIKELLKSKMQ